jgi:hypothetical protein
MNEYEKAVCNLFGEKQDVSYITKPALIKSLATLLVDYELLHVDLYEANSSHKRFKGWTASQREDMAMKIQEREKARKK